MSDDRRPALLVRWEAISPGRQFRLGYVASVALLLVLHLGGIAVGVFPNLHVWLGIFYALSEGLLLAGIVVLATQGEIARRRGTDLGGHLPDEPPAAGPGANADAD